MICFDVSHQSQVTRNVEWHGACLHRTTTHHFRITQHTNEYVLAVLFLFCVSRNEHTEFLSSCKCTAQDSAHAHSTARKRTVWTSCPVQCAVKQGHMHGEHLRGNSTVGDVQSGFMDYQWPFKCQCFHRFEHWVNI